MLWFWFGVSIGERVCYSSNRVHIGRVRSSDRSSSERSNGVGLESVTAATEFTLVVLESVTGTVL